MARPSSYTPDVEGLIAEVQYSPESHPVKLLKLLSEGCLNCQCISALNICEDTFYVWIKTHKDFGLAYRIGRPKAESYWALRLQEMVLKGDDKGSKACIMILNNNFGWNKDNNKNGTTNNTQINIHGNMNLLDSSKTDQELLEILNVKLQKLRLEQIPNEVIEAEIIQNSAENKDIK